MRVLFDPTAGEGGSSTSPAPPTQQPPATPPAAPPPAPTGVTLTPEQHKALLDAAAERDRLRAAEAEREAERQRRSEDEARKRGDFEKIIGERDRSLADQAKRLADIEDRSKRSERKRELALALAGAPLLEGWPEKLMRLWEDQFETRPAGDDGWEVRSLDGKTPAAFVAEQLARPEFAAIVRSGTRGGAATPGGTTGRPPANETEPRLHPALADYFRRQEEAAKVGHASMGLRPIPSSQ